MRRLQRLAPPLVLWFLAPMVAEYLLGDLTITQVGAFPVMALMYGGGAVLIREAVRRTGGSWPSYLCLALAYGVLEEGIADESLFNPDFMHAHLLAYGFWPALGTAPPWAVYVLIIHAVWSLAVPIGLAESLFPGPRDEAWLSRIGLGATALLFVLGVAAVTAFFGRTATHHATPAQLAVCAVLIAALIAAALAPRPQRPATARPPVYPPLWIGLFALLAGSALVLLYGSGAAIGWPAALTAGTEIGLGLLALFVLWRAGLGRWSAAQAWAASTGGLLVYAWHGYAVDRALHGGSDLAGHSLVVGALCALTVLAGLRVRTFEKTHRSAQADDRQDQAVRGTSRPGYA